MHLFTRNIGTAFHTLVKGFHTGKIGDYPLPLAESPSTQGEVSFIQEPMTITYSHPLERCLFNVARDWSPFLSLYEALYMLTGRNDLAPLAYYAKQWKQYSDDGKTLNGSYGYRWRKASCIEKKLVTVGDYEKPVWQDCQADKDQLKILINHLKASPTSRRAVLAMWNVEDDLLKIDTSKDVCCLAGDTQFRSPEGDENIATLARRFQKRGSYKYPVYTVDTVTGDQRLSWMTNAWKTGIRRTVILELDDSSSIRLTKDHVVFRKRRLFEGSRCVGLLIEECQAGDLKSGDSLLSEMPNDAAARKATGGYRVFKRNIFRNTSWDNLVREHREYYEFVTGDNAYGDDIHHINENTSDNRFDNLEKLTVSDHQKLHKIGENNPHCKMTKQDRLRRGRIHSAVMQSGGKENTPEEIRKILSKRPPYRTDDENNRLWEWVCSNSNHKIVSIKDGGITEVYDFTVPGRHNAVLSNGVLVHNCNLSVLFQVEMGMCRHCEGVCYGCRGNWTKERANELDEAPPPATCPNCSGTLKPDFVCPTCNGMPHEKPRYLNMTVVNRSNDLVWGALGTNHCTFTILQEYMAAHIGLEIGKYHQFTNNLHIYDTRKDWKPEELLEWEEKADRRLYDYIENTDGIKPCGNWKHFPLVKNPVIFDEEVIQFVRLNDGSGHYDDTLPDGRKYWSEPFLQEVARPLIQAFHFYKKGKLEVAKEWCSYIAANDWRVCATNWITRRINRRNRDEKDK